MNIKVSIIFFLVYLNFDSFAQSGCAGINLGQDTTIDCSQQ